MLEITTQNVDSTHEAWLSKLSGFIISRTRHFLTEETRKNGRTLTFLAALILFISLDFADLKGVDLLVISFNIKKGGPIIIAIVGLYYLISFMSDAKDERKIWEFQVLEKGLYESDPLKIIQKNLRDLKEKKEEIIERFKTLENEAAVICGVKEIDLTHYFNNDKRLTKFELEKIEVLTENNVKHAQILNILDSARKVEFDKLEALAIFIKFQIESYNNEIPKVKNSFRRKYYFSVLFPVAIYILSVVSILYSWFIKQ